MQLDTKITNESGIYIITNTINGKYYIGSSIRLNTRRQDHLKCLRNNKHQNNHLQNSFNKYGIEVFTFEILEIIPKEEFIDNNYLTDIEDMYFRAYMPYLRENGYNIYEFAKNRYGTKNPKLAASQSEFHIFYCPNGMLHEFFNLREFCRQNKLEQAAMQRVEKGKQTNHKGWTTPATRQIYLNYIAKYPLPPFYVISPEGIEYEVMSPANFAKEHGLFQASMDRLVRGKNKTCKGWRLKDNG